MAQTRKPTSKSAWQRRSDRGPHLATLPSQAVVRFVVPDSSTLLRSGRLPEHLREIALLCAAHPEGADGFMAELVMAATIAADRSQAVKDAISNGIELAHHLVAEMLVEPEVTPEEVAQGLFPELDIRMLLEFAERRRNVDAEGRKLPIQLLGEWATFRVERGGAAGAANGGGAGQEPRGDLPDADGGAV